MADAPFMYWVGLNTAPETSAPDVAVFNDFYNKTHAHEVIAANPGFFRASRYELCDPDPRGDFGPRWLAIYEMDGEEAARQYIARNDGPAGNRPNYTQGPAVWQQKLGWWRLMWRRIAPLHGEIGAGGAPYLYFVAMNVAPDIDEAGLRQFNDFYTNTHVPEVVSTSKFFRGTRYELYRDLRHPAPGAPRFLAVYEGDEVAIRTRDERKAYPGTGPQLSSGPPAWESHDTLWRLMYRRIES